MNTSTLSPERSKMSRILSASPMGFTGAALGNLYQDVSDEDAQATLQSAYANGIRVFHCAPKFGFGLSESRLGQAIIGFDRDEVVLSTEVGHLLTDAESQPSPDGNAPADHIRKIKFDYTYDGVMASYEQSLERLGIDHVDLLVADLFSTGRTDVLNAKLRELTTGGGFLALENLRQTGAIKAFGVGMEDWQSCERIMERHDIDQCMISNHTSLLETDAIERFLPMCAKRDVVVQLGKSYGYSLLVEGPSADNEPPKAKRLISVIKSACDAYDVPFTAGLLQILRRLPALTTIIAGATCPRDVYANLNVLNARPPAEFWNDLRGYGLC